MRSIIVLSALLATGPALAEEHYSGVVANVSDGDTFTMQVGADKIRVRLCGVDSPERGQPGYGQAAGELSRMIEGREVSCIQVGGGTPCDGRSKATNRNRIVAQCFIADKDVAMEMEMVCIGTAIDLPRFSAATMQSALGNHCAEIGGGTIEAASETGTVDGARLCLLRSATPGHHRGSLARALALRSQGMTRSDNVLDQIFWSTLRALVQYSRRAILEIIMSMHLVRC